jgi:hypothetical protein
MSIDRTRPQGSVLILVGTPLQFRQVRTPLTLAEPNDGGLNDSRRIRSKEDRNFITARVIERQSRLGAAIMKA